MEVVTVLVGMELVELVHHAARTWYGRMTVGLLIPKVKSTQ